MTSNIAGIPSSPPSDLHVRTAHNRKVITPPAVEPILKSDMKLYLKVPFDDQDSVIDGLISAARTFVEKHTNRLLITTIVDVYPGGFPYGGDLLLPFGQLQSITYLKYTDSGGAVTTLSQTGDDLLNGSTVALHIDNIGEPARLRPPFASIWPIVVLRSLNPIVIRMTCGYGDDGTDVPADIREAIALLAGHWYNNRDGVVLGKSVAIDSKRLQIAIDDILANYWLPAWG